MSVELGTRFLQLDRHGPIAIVRIDRPQARNALTVPMYNGIRRAVRLVEESPDLYALVLTGTGDVFAPGGDLGLRNDEPLPEGFNNNEFMPFDALRNSRVPVVAAVNGICQAGGLLTALLCDVTVASDRATFRAPELLRGFAEMWYAAVLPHHVGVARARELMMTARVVNAAEAVQMGLIGRMVPHEELMPAAIATAMQILETGPRARELFKEAVNALYGPVQRMTFAWTERSPDVMEGFSAFMEKRPPAWSPRLWDEHKRGGREGG
ncbi:MAG: enoyl-CoA hydratase/isomerase family protein [Gammaproteobacteria bacterium]